MTRVSLFGGVLGALVAIGGGARPTLAQQPGKPLETLIRLSVWPAPAPKPALRYQLLPELAEMSPGNPIEGYLKCYLEQYRFAFDEAGFGQRMALLSMPLEELPASDPRELGSGALAQADRAARLDKPDWQILPKLKKDGISTQLPDVQALRVVARALQARFRSEVSRDQVGDAMRTAKTMFAMARHWGEHPTLIGTLVGFGCANMAISPLEELLEQPDCPNLYWALTDLPDPFVSLRTGMDCERMWLSSLFRDLSRVTPMSADQLKSFIATMDRLLADSPQKPAGGLATYLAARAKDEQKIRAVRMRLVESGLMEANANAFSPDQVILLDAARECQERFDEIAKTTKFPTPQFEELSERSVAQKPDHAYFVDWLVPPLVNVRRAQARLEQRIALLRHVEALRMHAAEHGGALPAKLSQVSVPLPADPFTGKPFLYERTGNTAHLRGTPPGPAQNNAAFRVHYEITLKN